MPELRQDPATKKWVIIATERMQRPHAFRRAAARPAQPEYDPSCPFCPGLERYFQFFEAEIISAVFHQAVLESLS